MKIDPIEHLCMAISHLHAAVEEIARHVKVDVSHLLKASDCLTAQVLSDRYPPTLSPLSARSNGTKAQPESGAD